jgi:hypothetical protein
MKNERAIRAARNIIAEKMVEAAKKNLLDAQRAVLSGMSTALQWVCGDGGHSLDLLLSGEPLEAKSAEKVEQIIKESGERLSKLERCPTCGQWTL